MRRFLLILALIAILSFAAGIIVAAADAHHRPSHKPRPTPTPTPTPQPSGQLRGVNITWSPLEDLPKVTADIARVEWGLGTTPQTTDPYPHRVETDQLFRAYALKSIQVQPVLTFNGRIPSVSEAQTVGSLAERYGTGGSFWAANPDLNSALAMRYIEFGNETAYNYQWPAGTNFNDIGRRYAVPARAAVEAAAATGRNVGVLLQADGGGTAFPFLDGMHSADPTLEDHPNVAGYTSHPYGPSFSQRITALKGALNFYGIAKPIFITEWGLSTDNGRCLSDNYGWNRCMTYAEAASTFRGFLADPAIASTAQVILYSVRDLAASGASIGRESYFGAVRADGTAKGDYTTAVQQAGF